MPIYDLQHDWTRYEGDWFYVRDKETADSETCMLIIEVTQNDSGKERGIVIDLQKGNSFASLYLTQLAE